MSAKHTPGPWQVETAGLGHNGKFLENEVFVRRDGDSVAIASDITDPETEMPSKANARLIAAAPCLLDAAIDGEGALRAAAVIMETQGHRKTAERFLHYSENLRKATAKATGEGEA